MTAAVDNQSATPSLRHRIGRAAGRLRPGIGGFLTWWMHALASWLPPRLRMLLGLAHERVLLQRTGEELRLALRRGGGVPDLGQLPWTAIGRASVRERVCHDVLNSVVYVSIQK